MPADSRLDVAFGAGVTTDYVARGISQTSNHPAIQGFAEFDYNHFYSGVWASNVSLAGATDQEVDLALGWRPHLASFDFDFGYVQYLYLNHVMGSGFGEAYAGVASSISDNISIGAKVNFAPNYANSGTAATYLEATADIKLPHNLGISGALGYQVFDPNYAASYLNGNVGIYWNLNQATKLDLRASGTNLSNFDCANLMSVGNECGGKVLVSVSVSGLASDFAKKN